MEGAMGDTHDAAELWKRAELLLFDFDGVLADSEPLYRRSWNEALEPWGHVIPEEDYWEHWSSRGEGLAGEIARKGLEGIDEGLAGRRQSEAYARLCREGRVPLFEGAAVLLRRLSGGSEPGCRPFCIASNTDSGLVRVVLEAGGAPVPPIVGGEGLPRKPAPDIFLEAAGRMGADPRSTLVLEDSLKGALAAGKGGFRCVLVRNGLNGGMDIPCEAEVDGTEGMLGVMDLLQAGEGRADA